MGGALAETAFHAPSGGLSAISLSEGIAALALIAFGWWREGIRSRRANR
jgi:hypothetical protein